MTDAEKQELKELLLKFVRDTVNEPQTERSAAVEALPSVVNLLLDWF